MHFLSMTTTYNLRNAETKECWNAETQECWSAELPKLGNS